MVSRELNVSGELLDRPLKREGLEVAYYWRAIRATPRPHYQDLSTMTSRAANALKGAGLPERPTASRSTCR